jgi:hypothetical protein
MNEKLLSILTSIKEARTKQRDVTRAYRIANKHYQDLWQGEGDKLREALQKVTVRLLESPTASVIGSFNKAKSDLDQHNWVVDQAREERDALQKESAALDTTLFKLQSELYMLLDKEDVAA